MNIVFILAIAGIVIWILVASASWFLKVGATIVEIFSNLLLSLLKTVTNILGKSNLAYIHKEPQALLDLERKINSPDLEKSNLEKYSPKPYKAVQIKEIIYEQGLPKLFKRVGSITLNLINIDDVSSLTHMGSEPAYKLINDLRDRIQPICSLKPSQPPQQVEPPIEWTPWVCDVSNFPVTIPKYSGLFKPLNYFVDITFKKSIEIANTLEYRQKTVIVQAEKRNSEVKFLHEMAVQKYELAKQTQEAEWSSVLSTEKSIVEKYEKSHTEEKKKIELLLAKTSTSGSEGLIARVDQTLQLINFPSFVSSDFTIKYDESSKIFILEHEFPDIGGVSWHKLVQLKTGLTMKPANQKECKETANLLYPSLCLRLACEIARLDLDDLVDAVVVNGWSNYIEKSTGQQKRAYCASLFATKSQISSLNLVAADPLAAFSALKGVAARSLELTPIAPILRLNTEDKRFVDAKDILANMTQGENLAAMDWEDFEHLCRELFEKAFAGSGAEVKVTQASRDQGVDAVIFDPDVLRGGKIVVQAKRYTNTVDVSAVRDLYGAIINEGATKGILVTTSHYGPDAYSFAKDKPITLLNGAELLGLLEKYGYKFNINLAEAKRLNAEL
jgi:restriction system protein